MKILFARAAMGLALLPVAAAASEREHSAHEHGHVLLQIVQDGSALNIALQSPAVNIIGFEHHAESVADKKTLRATEQLLTDPEQLFSLPPKAGCSPQESELESELLEHLDEHDDHDKEDDHDDHEGKEEHSEFHAEYRYACNAPESLEYIDVNLFARFSGIEEIDVQVVTAGGQTATELEPGKTRVPLR